MGQKINSNFFRLNLQNNWNSEYIAKNVEENSLYLFTDIMLKKYLIRFFKLHGLIVMYCKTFISQTIVKVMISFFITLKTIKTIVLDVKKKVQYKKKKKKNIYFFNKTIVLKLLPRKRLFILKKERLNFYKKKFIIKRKMILNSFSNKLLEVLKLYFSDKVNILILFQKVNKGKSLRLKNNESIIFRKIILQLRMYFKFNFFKEIINILIIVLKKKDSARLLAEFLAFQLSILKQHNNFLRFLKQSFKLLITSNFSCIKGLKIHFKGRVNGVPRASIKGIDFGNLPISTLKHSIKYFKSTSYTINGTIGIKVWLYENI